jgi:hypothetical protein
MPLEHSKSEPAFRRNVETLMHEAKAGTSAHVKSPSQALAIAYAIKRRGKANGGFALGGAAAPWFVRNEARSMLHSGPVLSAVPGRTDRHNVHVPSGSYVMPAAAVSHLGQSNTMAGAAVLNKMFHASPYGGGTVSIKHGMGPPKPPRPMAPPKMGSPWHDRGGARDGAPVGHPTPIVIAGGEYLIPPHHVMAIGGGNLAHGHKVLDAWVKSLQEDHAKTIRKLPAPAKS